MYMYSIRIASEGQTYQSSKKRRITQYYHVNMIDISIPNCFIKIVLSFVTESRKVTFENRADDM